MKPPFTLTRAAVAIAAASAFVVAGSRTPELGDLHNEFEALRPELIRHAPRALIEQSACSLSISEPQGPNPTISDGGFVTVGWTCDVLPDPEATWIGAYSPPPKSIADLNSTYPVRMTWNLASASGSVRMQFGNYRQNMSFVMMAGGNYYRAPCCPLYITGLGGDVVSFAQPNEPVRPRLMMVDDSEANGVAGVKVLWSTLNSAKPTLQWGTEQGGALPNTAPASTSRVRRESMLNEPANSTGWFDLGSIHSANISVAGLTPEQRNGPIYYRFGDPDLDLWSATLTMQLPPLPGAPRTRNFVSGVPQPLSLGIVCDYGRGSADDSTTWVEYGRPAVNTTRVLRGLTGLDGVDAPALRAVGGNTISAVVVGGDLSYANGILNVWNSYATMTAQFATAVPMLSVLGNHELNSPGNPQLTARSISAPSNNDGGGEGGIVTQVLYPLPNQVPNLRWAYWSLDVGLVHLIALSTDQVFTTDSRQWQWLQSDLGAVNRSLTPWVVVVAHRPMYIDSTDDARLGSDQGVAELMREHLEPLFWAHQVNLGLYGHNHALQRLSAVLGGQLVQASVPLGDGSGAVLQRDPQATVHYVVGNGGAGFTRNAETASPPYAERVEYVHGPGVLTVHNASHLQWRVLAGDSQAVIDDLWIVRPDPLAPWSLGPPGVAPLPLGSRSAVVVGSVCGALAGVGLLAGLVLAVRRRSSGSLGSKWQRTASAAALPSTAEVVSLPAALQAHAQAVRAQQAAPQLQPEVAVLSHQIR